MAKKKLKKVHSLEEIEEIKRNQRLLTISIVSCVIYLVILYWIVLFKMRTDLSEITPIRQIILTPFHRKDISSTSKFAEALGNGVLMVPLGVYVSMFFKKMRFLEKVCIFFAVSFSFEIIQYIFWIGYTELTDIILNTFSGALGIWVFNIFRKTFKKHHIMFLNICVWCGTIVAMLVTKWMTK